MSTTRCPLVRCGARLVIDTDGNGRVVAICPQCERKRRQICRDCPRPTASRRHVRCTTCAKARALAFDRRNDQARYPKRREAILASHRKRLEIPEVREHRRQYMRDYRAAHPRNAFDRAYQRVYMQQRRQEAAFRAREAAAKREYRERKKQAVAA